MYDQIIDQTLLIRRLNIVACNVLRRDRVELPVSEVQLDLFADPELPETAAFDPEKERKQQQAVLSIKRKYGKNAILKGMNLEEGATAMDRNRQIGGHKA